MISIRTDLALEAREFLIESASDNLAEIPGIKVETKEKPNINITKITVLNSEGESAINKPIGNYITIEINKDELNNPDFFTEAAKVLSEELQGISAVNKDKTTLVTGLGNRNITPDSLGPKVVSNLVITRHLFKHLPDVLNENMSPVCAVAPGVLGLTGMETSEIVQGVSQNVKPDLIIAVDALASRKTDRLCTTIQISDTGINPGSGVANHRNAINKESMGVPVIAIGVPMVVDAVTIANDSIELMSKNLPMNDLSNKTSEERYSMISGHLPESLNTMMVTPKEIDILSEKLAKIVANGINMCLHKDITETEIETFIS